MNGSFTTIRIPSDLHERLKQQAERDRRTVGAELAWLLEHALDDEEQAHRQGRKTGARSR